MNKLFTLLAFIIAAPFLGFSQPNVNVLQLSNYPNDLVYQINNYNVVDNKLYFFGGFQSGSSPYVCSDKIMTYDLNTSSFTEQEYSLPYGIFDYCGASYNNGKFYLSPGFASGNTNGWGTHKKIIEVNVSSQQCTETQLVNGGDIWNMTNVSVNGNIYFFGGHDGSDKKGIYEYNTSTNNFQLVANLNYVRNNSAVIYGNDGWIYVIGDWSQTVNIERFSPSTYDVEDLGISSPINKPYFYWHIASDNTIFFFDSYSDNSELYKFSYNDNVIENTGVNVQGKFVNRCFTDPNNENVIYGLKDEGSLPYKLCKLTLEDYTSTSNLVSLENLVAFPNPTDGNINFINLDSSVTRIILVDSYGKVVLDKANFNKKIDISSFQSGFYTMFFKDEHNRTLGTKKIIKR